MYDIELVMFCLRHGSYNLYLIVSSFWMLSKELQTRPMAILGLLTLVFLSHSTSEV